jgi:hypothetical protein
MSLRKTLNGRLALVLRLRLFVLLHVTEPAELVFNNLETRSCNTCFLGCESETLGRWVALMSHTRPKSIFVLFPDVCAFTWRSCSRVFLHSVQLFYMARNLNEDLCTIVIAGPKLRQLYLKWGQLCYNIHIQLPGVQWHAERLTVRCRSSGRTSGKIETYFTSLSYLGRLN